MVQQEWYQKDANLVFLFITLTEDKKQAIVISLNEFLDVYEEVAAGKYPEDVGKRKLALGAIRLDVDAEVQPCPATTATYKSKVKAV